VAGPQDPAGANADAEALALKADKDDLEALEVVVATKASQVLLANLSAEVAGKQSQLRAGDVVGGHPLLTYSYDEDLVGSDTVRALKVSAPLVATQAPFVVEISLDGSLATQEELDGTNAQLLTTKSNVNSLFASNELLSSEVGALNVEMAGKQSQLTPGTVAGGHPMLQNGVVRAIKGAGPVKVAVDTNHVEVWLNQSELAATPAIAALQTSVAGKQSQLNAGDVAGGHPLLLPGVAGGGFFEPGQSPPSDTV
jgi:hypothetical protein